MTDFLIQIALFTLVLGAIFGGAVFALVAAATELARVRDDASMAIVDARSGAVLGRIDTTGSASHLENSYKFGQVPPELRALARKRALQDLFDTLPSAWHGIVGAAGRGCRCIFPDHSEG